MEIEVRLLANLNRFLPPGSSGRSIRLALPDHTAISGLMAHLGIPVTSVHLVAVNGRHQQDLSYVLSDGDVVSIFPPLAGGSPPSALHEGPLPQPAAADYRQTAGSKARQGPFQVGPQAIDLAALSAAVANPAAGAIVTFEGVVRNNARGKSVTRLEYEAYEPMAEETLAQIGRELAERWDLCGVAMSHRVGSLAVGVASIGIAVSAAHRKEAFAACAYAMDRIKEILPVWKKEFAEDGATWVEGPGEHKSGQ